MRKLFLLSIVFIGLLFCPTSIVNAQGVGINTPTPNVALDVNGAFATRTTVVNLTANSIVTVGNNSHIILSTTGNAINTPYIFTLTAGQPGQYLVLELQSGYAQLQNTGNVKLTSAFASFLVPFSVLYLKWDDVNSAWIELSRNASVYSYLPVNPPSSYNGKQVFTYTGSNQTLTLPGYAFQVFVKMWAPGGGGATNGAGGSGAFVSGYLPVTAGSALTVIVGGAGIHATTSASVAGGFGGGGASGGSTNGTFLTASGGGRSSIQITAGTDAVTAGGGAGGGSYPTNSSPYGGGGGATAGADGGAGYSIGPSGVGHGGTTTGGGAASTGGSANSQPGSLQAGSAGGSSTYGGGGGGSGYYGGSGGAGNTGASPNGGGGGGSSFITNLTSVTNIAGLYNGGGSPNAAPNNTDVDYIAGVGTGGGQNLNGGNGLVVVYW